MTTTPRIADRADQRAHGVDRRAVAAVLVAAADPAARGHGGRLGDADQLEGEVAVGGRAVGAPARVLPERTLGGAATRDLLRTVPLSSRLGRGLRGGAFQYESAGARARAVATGILGDMTERPDEAARERGASDARVAPAPPPVPPADGRRSPRDPADRAARFNAANMAPLAAAAGRDRAGRSSG